MKIRSVQKPDEVFEVPEDQGRIWLASNCFTLVDEPKDKRAPTGSPEARRSRRYRRRDMQAEKD